MRILVTGATGFMGSMLVPELIRQGHSVKILVRDRNIALKKFGASCDIIEGDLTDKKSLINCANDIDIVFHLAALMGHDLPSDEAFKRFRKVNVLGTKNLVDSCKKSAVRKFIYISSTAAMGLLKEPTVNEHTECRPFTPYQVSKYEGERVVKKAAKEFDLPSIIVRPSMVYGPGFKGDFLTIAKVCKTGFFPKIGLGDNLSPALYIDDLIQALISFIDHGVTGETYIISSEESYPLKEAVLAIANTMNKKIHFIYAPVWLAVTGAKILEMLCKVFRKKAPVTARNIKSTVTNRIFDISKAKQDINFEQKVTLQEGLKETVKYYIEEGFI